ncbi:MAG: macro domain-containing protein, partial [Endomicrobium sp.]|nr:macro domain-containing protein [Endomicrobium sp.]
MQHVEMTKQIGKTEITVLEGADIVNLGGATVDAIVNAANYGLQGGGGVCGAIFKAAGKKELKQECNQFEKICGRYRCHTGGAKVTDAFSLRKQGIKWIVHAVGPNLKGGLRGNIDKSGQDVCYTLGSSEAREALKDAYTSALSELKKKDSTAKSIVFPCISTSIFGYPRNEAAGVALEAVREYVEGHSDDYDKIILACLDEEDYKEYMSLHFFSDGNDQQKKPIVGGNVGQGQVPEIGQEVRGEEQPEPNGDDDVDQVQVPEIGQEVQGAEQLKLDEKAGLRLLKKSIEKIFEVSDKISDKIKDQVLAKACVCALSASSDAKKREDADKLKSMLDEVKELEDSKEEKSEENKSRMSDLMKFVERLKAEMDQADRDWFNEIIQGLTREMGKEADGEDSKFKKQIVAIKARIEDLKKGKEGNEKIWEGIITGGMGLVMEKYSLNKALKMNYKGLKGEVQGHLGFVGNMLRSVCNGNSCGEEVFREMSIGGLVRGEGEVLKK